MGNTFCHVTTDDINMDGYPDAFFHGCFGHLLLLGDGTGEFTEDYYKSSTTQSWEGAVGDFDLDGDMDYASAGRPVSSMVLYIYLNKTITNGVEQQEGDPCQPMLSLLSSPVISTASISVTLSEPNSCLLSAFDLYGRKVTTIHDGPLPSGSTELQWNTGELPPGCYFLRLTTISVENAVARCLVVE